MKLVFIYNFTISSVATTIPLLKKPPFQLFDDFLLTIINSNKNDFFFFKRTCVHDVNHISDSSISFDIHWSITILILFQKD